MEIIQRSIFVGYTFVVYVVTLFIFSQASMAITLQDLPPNVLKSSLHMRQVRGIVGIIVASDNKRSESGEIAANLLKKEGFSIKGLSVVKNLDVYAALNDMLMDPEIQAIVCIGGTGISPHDVTIEAVKGVIQKDLPGFGELFRLITYEKWGPFHEKIGILALNTRAMAGVTGNNKIIFAVPGSPDATRMAVGDLINPGLPSLLGQLQKKEG